MWTCDERNTYMESSSSDSYGFSLSNEPSKQVFLFFSFHWFVSISNSKVNSIWYCSYFSTLESSLEESSLELKDHKYSLYKTQMQNTIKIFTSFKICPSRKIYSRGTSLFFHVRIAFICVMFFHIGLRIFNKIWSLLLFNRK